MAKQKIIAVSITALKITYEDEWLEWYTKFVGEEIIYSPQAHVLRGELGPLREWFEYRKLDWVKRANKIFSVFTDVAKNGQKEPIKIYKDMRINDGHKRSAAMNQLKFEKIEAIYVPDDYKL